MSRSHAFQQSRNQNNCYCYCLFYTLCLMDLNPYVQNHIYEEHSMYQEVILLICIAVSMKIFVFFKFFNQSNSINFLLLIPKQYIQ